MSPSTYAVPNPLLEEMLVRLCGVKELKKRKHSSKSCIRPQSRNDKSFGLLSRCNSTTDIEVFRGRWEDFSIIITVTTYFRNLIRLSLIGQGINSLNCFSVAECEDINSRQCTESKDENDIQFTGNENKGSTLLPFLTHLCLSENCLRDLRGLSQLCANLEKLILDKNLVSSVWGIREITDKDIPSTCISLESYSQGFESANPYNFMDPMSSPELTREEQSSGPLTADSSVTSFPEIDGKDECASFESKISGYSGYTIYTNQNEDSLSDRYVTNLGNINIKSDENGIPNRSSENIHSGDPRIGTNADSANSMKIGDMNREVMSDLKFIDISENRITEIIGFFDGSFPSVEYLNLACNRINDNSLVLFSKSVCDDTSHLSIGYHSVSINPSPQNVSNLLSEQPFTVGCKSKHHEMIHTAGTPSTVPLKDTSVINKQKQHINSYSVTHHLTSLNLTGNSIHSLPILINFLSSLQKNYYSNTGECKDYEHFKYFKTTLEGSPLKIDSVFRDFTDPSILLHGSSSILPNFRNSINSWRTIPDCGNKDVMFSNGFQRNIIGSLENNDTSDTINYCSHLKNLSFMDPLYGNPCGVTSSDCYTDAIVWVCPGLESLDGKSLEKGNAAQNHSISSKVEDLRKSDIQSIQGIENSVLYRSLNTLLQDTVVNLKKSFLTIIRELKMSETKRRKCILLDEMCIRHIEAVCTPNTTIIHILTELCDECEYSIRVAIMRQQFILLLESDTFGNFCFSNNTTNLSTSSLYNLMEAYNSGSRLMLPNLLQLLCCRSNPLKDTVSESYGSRHLDPSIKNISFLEFNHPTLGSKELSEESKRELPELDRKGPFLNIIGCPRFINDKKGMSQLNEYIQSRTSSACELKVTDFLVGKTSVRYNPVNRSTTVLSNDLPGSRDGVSSPRKGIRAVESRIPICNDQSNSVSSHLYLGKVETVTGEVFHVVTDSITVALLSQLRVFSSTSTARCSSRLLSCERGFTSPTTSVNSRIQVEELYANDEYTAVLSDSSEESTMHFRPDNALKKETEFMDTKTPLVHLGSVILVDTILGRIAPLSPMIIDITTFDINEVQHELDISRSVTEVDTFLCQAALGELGTCEGAKLWYTTSPIQYKVEVDLGLNLDNFGSMDNGIHLANTVGNTTLHDCGIKEKTLLQVMTLVTNKIDFFNYFTKKICFSISSELPKTSEDSQEVQSDRNKTYSVDASFMNIERMSSLFSNLKSNSKFITFGFHVLRWLDISGNNLTFLSSDEREPTPRGEHLSGSKKLGFNNQNGDHLVTDDHIHGDVSYPGDTPNQKDDGRQCLQSDINHGISVSFPFLEYLDISANSFSDMDTTLLQIQGLTGYRNSKLTSIGLTGNPWNMRYSIVPFRERTIRYVHSYLPKITMIDGVPLNPNVISDAGGESGKSEIGIFDRQCSDVDNIFDAINQKRNEKPQTTDSGLLGESPLDKGYGKSKVKNLKNVSIGEICANRNPIYHPLRHYFDFACYSGSDYRIADGSLRDECKNDDMTSLDIFRVLFHDIIRVQGYTIGTSHSTNQWCRNITTLCVDDCGLLELSPILALGVLHSLVRLSARNNKINEIGSFPMNHNSNNGKIISGEGCFSSIGPWLRFLDLSFNNISSTGVRGLVRFPSLVEVYLDHNLIDDIKVILDFHALGKLRSLSLIGNSCTKVSTGSGISPWLSYPSFLLYYLRGSGSKSIVLKPAEQKHTGICNQRGSSIIKATNNIRLSNTPVDTKNVVQGSIKISDIDRSKTCSPLSSISTDNPILEYLDGYILTPDIIKEADVQYDGYLTERLLETVLFEERVSSGNFPSDIVGENALSSMAHCLESLDLSSMGLKSLCLSSNAFASINSRNLPKNVGGCSQTASLICPEQEEGIPRINFSLLVTTVFQKLSHLSLANNSLVRLEFITDFSGLLSLDLQSNKITLSEYEYSEHEHVDEPLKHSTVGSLKKNLTSCGNSGNQFPTSSKAFSRSPGFSRTRATMKPINSNVNIKTRETGNILKTKGNFLLQFPVDPHGVTKKRSSIDLPDSIINGLKSKDRTSYGPGTPKQNWIGGIPCKNAAISSPLRSDSSHSQSMIGIFGHSVSGSSGSVETSDSRQITGRGCRHRSKSLINTGDITTTFSFKQSTSRQSSIPPNIASPDLSDSLSNDERNITISRQSSQVDVLSHLDEIHSLPCHIASGTSSSEITNSDLLHRIGIGNGTAPSSGGHAPQVQFVPPICPPPLHRLPSVLGSKLKSLNVSFNRVSNPGIRLRNFLGGAISLQEMYLDGNPILHIDLREDFIFCPNLRILSLNSCRIHSLKRFSKDSGISSVVRSDQKEHVYPIQQAVVLPFLDTLFLTDNKLSSLEDIQNLPSLHSLDVSYNRLSNPDTVHVVNDFSSNLPALRSLNLQRNPVTRSFLYRLYAIRYMPRITTLDQISVTEAERIKVENIKAAQVTAETSCTPANAFVEGISPCISR